MIVCPPHFCFFFFNDTATTEIYTLSLHDALPISRGCVPIAGRHRVRRRSPVLTRIRRRVRGGDARDARDLRHRRDPRRELRGGVSPEHVRADHAARAVFAVALAAPSGGAAGRKRCAGLDRWIKPWLPAAIRLSLHLARGEPVDRVRIAAHAKLNLLLRILAREAPAGGAGRGYHQIETAFALLELADELVVTRTKSGVTLTVHGPDLGPPEANLAVRAARAALEATGSTFGVAIELTKRIPVRAGLGGGSSDAAAALHAVNALVSTAVPRPELLHYGVRLGADVAFFASGVPAAVPRGPGQRPVPR